VILLTTTTQAIAEQERSTVNLIPQYREEFSEVLPDHVKAVTFVRLAQAALRKSPDLLKAANNDPGSLIYALREAARLGHEPGTEAFYLVPMGGKVEGWEGYRGVVERMYRAGAVSSVKAEVVCANDTFEYDPAEDARPHHKVSWFTDRGEIIGAWAFAEMKAGGTSKVVVIGKADIDATMAMSKSSGRADSPWRKWRKSMVLKTVIHRLEPFVPTSSEYIREQLRAVRDVQNEQPVPAQSEAMSAPQITDVSHLSEVDGDYLDGELVDQPMHPDDIAANAAASKEGQP